MRRGYVYKKPVKRSQYSSFRRYMFIIGLFILIAGGISYFVYSSLHNNPKSSPVSGVENTVINGSKTTFTDTFFQFQDTGTWVLDKPSSTDNKRLYHKFNKSVQLSEMVIYINQVPIPLYLEVPRALPVHIVNNNSFSPTNVSSPCVTQYAKGELHKVREVSINGATMLCDPDSPQYAVVVSEINGDYRLNLKRPNGTPIQFVITFKDTSLSTQPDSLINVVSSFQTR